MFVILHTTTVPCRQQIETDSTAIVQTLHGFITKTESKRISFDTWQLNPKPQQLFYVIETLVKLSRQATCLKITDMLFSYFPLSKRIFISQNAKYCFESYFFYKCHLKIHSAYLFSFPKFPDASHV